MLFRSFLEITRLLITTKLWKYNNSLIIFPESLLYYIFEMSSIPQGAFITMKIRKNMDSKKEYMSDNNMENLAATNYSSKFMNSIWGMYNRYAVHNLKKNIDKVGSSTNYSIPH